MRPSPGVQVAGHNLVNSTAGLHKHDAFGKELIIKTGGGERWEKSTWHLLGTVLPSPHHRHLCDNLLPSPISLFPAANTQYARPSIQEPFI